MYSGNNYDVVVTLGTHRAAATALATDIASALSELLTKTTCYGRVVLTVQCDVMRPDGDTASVVESKTEITSITVHEDRVPFSMRT